MPAFKHKDTTITATRITQDIIETNNAMMEVPRTYATFTNEQGREIMGNEGDWLVTMADGHITIVSDKDLHENYEEV